MRRGAFERFVFVEHKDAWVKDCWVKNYWCGLMIGKWRRFRGFFYQKLWLRGGRQALLDRD